MSESNKRTPALVEKFVIRLPNGLREQIKALSEQNRRSMNSEIIMVLENTLSNLLRKTFKNLVLKNFFRKLEMISVMRTSKINKHL